jgi:NAD-specific glutamate dehydrogenase
VLLAHAKNSVHTELLNSDLPDAPELEAELLDYFPQHVLAESNGKLEAWVAQRPDAVARIQEMVTEIGRATPPDIAMLAVASRQLRAMTAG